MNSYCMGLTTERKIFLGLMVIAGGSLIVDQAILSPNSASAASLDINQVDSFPNEPILAGISEPIAKSVTQILNERLGSALEGQGVNIEPAEFQQMFNPLVKPKAQSSSTKLAEIAPDREQVAVEPAQQIPVNMPSLSAVMPSRSGHSGAILNGALYRVGDQTPLGYSLITVEERKVLVEYKGHKYWLTLPAFED